MIREVQAYRRFVDDVVRLRRSGETKRARPGARPWAGLEGLSEGQRVAVARLIQRSAEEAVGRVLAYLEDEDYVIGRAGVKLPAAPFGRRLHEDFEARIKGEEWPKHGE
jgi:hypothetical protein